jgi:hypothetical protein
MQGDHNGPVDQLRDYGDARLTAGCAYCGRAAETRDHVPARVFLDEPYPSNLPVVGACDECNQAASHDEVYVACLIECARMGSVDPSGVERPKIRRILTERPALAARLTAAKRFPYAGVAFAAERRRVSRVLEKAALGHALYELDELLFDEPATVAYAPISVLAVGEVEAFENRPPLELFPEVGSRAMQRVLIAAGPGEGTGFQDWIEVQPDRYRYLTASGPDTVIRIVLSEYLACEVIWSAGATMERVVR